MSLITVAKPVIYWTNSQIELVETKGPLYKP